MHPRLSEYFVGAASKLVSAVEVSHTVSNQHELNGVKALVALLGEPEGKEVHASRFISLEDDRPTQTVAGTLTWYDARRQAREQRGVMRSEYRLYYPANPVMDRANPGDLLVLARQQDGSLVVVVSDGASSSGSQLRALFGLQDRGERFALAPSPSDRSLTLAATALLEALGIDIHLADERRLEGLLSRFGDKFPTTTEFSAHARTQVSGVLPLSDPDGALVEWMTMEEVLFRTLENHILRAELAGVADQVEEILAISQRAFQRRRSRAGHALENHVQHLLVIHGISHAHGAVTEGTKRPDFLFPGASEYADTGYPAGGLAMLGVKRTCKDRWRQVLTEADRIPSKYLLTMEAPISTRQLDEMAAADLTLVVPAELQVQFAPADVPRLLSVRELLAVVEGVAGPRASR